ncbi:MAG: aminoacyl-tRNA hydrolase [Cellvibrionaceae bacterium]|nr:aminoacyl-tRNA hydrolase [Cellvibrionaceae bacterium]
MKQTPVQLIVGLGNPGPEYTNTRHNAGQDLVEELARQYQIPLSPTPKFFGYSGRGSIGGQEVRLIVPTTYMNRSGQAVNALAQFYRIPAEAILVAHDELDLPPGVARFKFSGGHGGHNGLRDIISALGNNKDFARLRLGIGHPGNAKQVADYVLKRAPQTENELIQTGIERSLAVIRDIVSGDWERAMRNLHTQ